MVPNSNSRGADGQLSATTQARALFVAEEFDEVYERLEWMERDDPTEGEETSGLGDLPTPQSRDRLRHSWRKYFPEVRLEPRYLEEILKRDRGSVRVEVHPGPTDETAPEHTPTVVMKITLHGLIDPSAVQRKVAEALQQAIELLGQVGKPKDSWRPEEAIYLTWLTTRKHDPISVGAAANHWNDLRNLWYALEVRDPNSPDTGPTPLADNPKARYAYLEWKDLHAKGEEHEAYDGGRVAQLTARLRPLLHERPRSLPPAAQPAEGVEAAAWIDPFDEPVEG